MLRTKGSTESDVTKGAGSSVPTRTSQWRKQPSPKNHQRTIGQTQKFKARPNCKMLGSQNSRSLDSSTTWIEPPTWKFHQVRALKRPNLASQQKGRDSSICLCIQRVPIVFAKGKGTFWIGPERHFITNGKTKKCRAIACYSLVTTHCRSVNIPIESRPRLLRNGQRTWNDSEWADR